MHKHPAIFWALILCAYSFGGEVHIQNERPTIVGVSPRLQETFRSELGFSAHPRTLFSVYLPEAMGNFESTKRLLDAEGIPYSVSKVDGMKGAGTDTMLTIECDWTDGGDAATLGGPPGIRHGLTCVMDNY